MGGKALRRNDPSYYLPFHPGPSIGLDPEDGQGKGTSFA